MSVMDPIIRNVSKNLRYVHDGENIQGVINSISGASATNLYTVMVPPGHENESFNESIFIRTLFINSIPYNVDCGLMAALNTGRSAAMQVIGDSTGNDTDEWAYLLGQWFAAQRPDLTVKYHAWNDDDANYDGKYDPAITIQTGTAGTRYLVFDGANVGTLERERFSGVTTDLDIRLRLDGSWLPAVSSYVAAWSGAAGKRSYGLMIQSNGIPRMGWTENGTTWKLETATAAIDPGIVTPLWVRATIDVDNGAANAEIKFFTSADDVNESKSVTTWTQLGATVLNGATTSIYTGTGMDDVDPEMGAANGGFKYTGNIYALETYGEIDGVIPLHSIAIDSWFQKEGSDAFTKAGAPVLHILNGSKGGINYSYLNNNATLQKQMMPDYGQLLTFISISHNSKNWTVGKRWLDIVEGYKNTVESLLPLTNLVYVLQNPAEALVEAHSSRRISLMAWAAKNNYQVIDVYKAFLQQGFTGLMADAVHPNAVGQALWTETVKKYLGDESSYIFS